MTERMEEVYGASPSRVEWGVRVMEVMVQVAIVAWTVALWTWPIWFAVVWVAIGK